MPNTAWRVTPSSHQAQPDFILSILSKWLPIQRDRIDRIDRMKFICDFGIRHSVSSIQSFHKLRDLGERDRGFEPRLPGWKPGVVPLDQSRRVVVLLVIESGRRGS